MKKLMKLIICITTVLSLMLPGVVNASKGICGYEGGISSGDVSGKTSYDYVEVCFITGEPIIFKGTLTLKKAYKQGNLNTTYTYNLKNTDKNATLTRIVTFSTKSTTKENGQTIEETSISGTPSESIKIANTVYTLKTYDFTHTDIIDERPAINYYSGNLWGRKQYQTSGLSGSGTITVDMTGEFYGYDQYWSNVETITYNYYIASEMKKGNVIDKWGGEAQVAVSSTVTKEIQYIENQPDQISFEGGYMESQVNNSIMEYSYKMPEFDSQGISTDVLIENKGSLQLDSTPVFRRLPVPDTSSIKGNWYEEDVKQLLSLEVFSGNGKGFNPHKYMTRAEFTSAITRAAKEVPQDQALINATKPTSSSSKKTDNKVEIIFDDVKEDSWYFNDINSAYKRNLVNGRTSTMFYPDDYITRADAICIIIRALGLENMAPSPVAVTSFKDNDQIPKYARNAVYVAESIGLVSGDDNGYLNPNQYLTYGQSAVIINRLINYMRTGIREDYRDHIINYQ